MFNILITFKVNLQTCIVFATLIQIPNSEIWIQCILNSIWMVQVTRKGQELDVIFLIFTLSLVTSTFHFSPVERLERGNSPESNWSINSLIYFDLAKQGRVQQHSAGPLIINNDLSIIHKTFSGICGALPRLCVLQEMHTNTHTHTHTLFYLSLTCTCAHTSASSLIFYRPILLLLPC